MARVADVHNIPINGAQDLPRRGSPSEVFSRDILEMERSNKNNVKQQQKSAAFFKWIGIIFGVLCVLFLLATIGLAIALGIKMNQQNNQNGEVLFYFLLQFYLKYIFYF
jgi:uncharacterized protein YqhQ